MFSPIICQGLPKHVQTQVMPQKIQEDNFAAHIVTWSSAFFFCDHTATVGLGMPLSAYGRSEPMSDVLNTILFNPYMIIPDLDFRQTIATFCLF